MKRTALERNIRLARGSRLKAKRPLVTSQEKLARELVTRRSGGWCELRIDGCGGPPTDWQHRRNRSQGGPWAASNGLACCRPCHSYVHAHPALAMANGWTVRSTDDWRTTPVLLFDGLVLLDDHGHRHDPPTDQTDDGGLTPHQKEAS